MGSGSSKSNRSKEPAENTNVIQKVQNDNIKNIDSSEKIKPRDYAPKGVRKPHPPIELPKKPPRRTSGDFVAFEPEQLQLKDDWELEKGVDDETPLSDVSYPTPRPGKVITDRHSFSDVDFTIFKTNNPYLAKGTFEEVATEVTKDWESELSKVRALCTWISCQRVRTRTYSNEANDSTTVAGYMKQVKELDGTFAALLARLCRAIDIPCVIVRGIYRSAFHVVGEDDLKQSRCTWNAVYVDGSWQLVHPYLICTPLSNQSPSADWKIIESTRVEPPARNAAVLNSYFFAPKPSDFIKLCLPDETNYQWQLLETDDMVKYSNFIKLPFLRPAFYDAGMHLRSCHKSVLLSEAGVYTIKIQCQVDMANDLQLMYELSSLDKNFVMDPKWGKMVLNGRNEDVWNVQVKFPVHGTFKVSLYAQLEEWFFWVGDFKIICDVPFSHFVPQPAVPTEVGFGPATLCENAGLFSPSHEGGIVFYKVNEEHTIKFLNTDKLSLRHEIENPEYETDDLRKYCKMIVRKSEIDFVVNLPLHGEFALRIYKMNDKMEGTNVCNYLFTDADDGRGRENVFQRKARWTLREGTAGHEVQVLEQALQKFNQVKIKHDDDYLRGSRRLKYLQLRKGLRDGRMRRHEETLEKAVAEAKASSFHRALGRSIEKANVLLKQLSSLEANCHPVQDMCHKTISEIANFNKPTRDVHNTMIATYLLLGESRYFLETWSNIQALLRRQGKESIQYRITEFQKQAAPDRAIIQAVQHLHNLVPKAYIVSASLSAAAFYDWVSSVLSYLKNTSQNAREAEAEEIDLLDEKHMYLDDVGSDEGFQDSHDIETSSTSAADKSSKAS